MNIQRIGTQSSSVGPTEWFTGAVRIDPLFRAPDPARVGGASVTFDGRWWSCAALGWADRGNPSR